MAIEGMKQKTGIDGYNLVISRFKWLMGMTFLI